MATNKPPMSERRTVARILAWMMILPSAVSPTPPAAMATAAAALLPECSTSTNPIVLENCLAGDPQAVGDPDLGNGWDLADRADGDSSIQGFATEFSINKGETVHFKIDTDSTDYRLDIYRMGYYGGTGARKVATVAVQRQTPQVQPDCLTDPATGLIDCGNWAESVSWDTSTSAAFTVPSAPLVSGIYFAKAIRENNPASASHIFFVIRDDNGNSPLLFQTSDTTWQAYNEYGGNSLYSGGGPVGRAYKVSYNRPFITRASSGGKLSWVFSAEYPMVSWLEKNEYNVSYISGIDGDRFADADADANPATVNPIQPTRHKIFLSVGHDEYWSGRQRANVENARNAGMHLAFFSGNEVFWKIRWADNYRTMVCYKETNADIDPSPEWTGAWRDPRDFDPASSTNREPTVPENALTGTLFMVNGERQDSIMVPASFGRHRFWRGTSIAQLQPGQTAILPYGTLGYEWDEDIDNGYRPAGLQRLSQTTVDVTPRYLLDYSSTYGAGTATHSLTLYRAASGALVFGAGTVQWSWGLDINHDNFVPDADPIAAAQGRKDMRQATMNLFNDMGVSADNPQDGATNIITPIDVTPPTSTIVSPPVSNPPATVYNADPLVISGTAFDDDRLSGVEVSVNNGATWASATGTTNWTYNWTQTVSGLTTIKSRAIDDTGNVQTTPASVTINVLRECPCSIWASGDVPANPDGGDLQSVELGMQFRADTNGVITGIQFYKSAANTGAHVGNLWTNAGALLATANFVSETAAGWQQVDFANPVQISAGTTYVASYFAPNGHYAIDRPSPGSGFTPGPGFSVEVANAPLRGLQDGADGANGVYRYSVGTTFPTETFGSTNYFVDVVFVPASSVETATPFISAKTPVAGATGVTAFINVTAKFSAAINPATVTPQTFELRTPSGVPVPATVSYVPGTRTAILDPTDRLLDDTVYTVTVRGGTGGIADLSGNTMTGNVLWSFTTAGPVACTRCTIWPTDATAPVPTVLDEADPAAETQGIELGVTFRSDVDGVITGIRFYKSAANLGPDTVTLWDFTTGIAVATATATSETPSGWQEVAFTSPVPIEGEHTYVASYNAPTGHYSLDRPYFTAANATNFTRPPLRALVDDGVTKNGVFKYGTSAFPDQTYLQTNYWVDVVFATAANSAPVAVDDSYPVNAGETLNIWAPGVLANDTDADLDGLSADLVGGATNGSLTLSPNGSFSYVPMAGFSGPDTFTYRASDGRLTSNVASVTINVAPQTTISISDVVVTEGDLGAVSAVFTVSLSAASTQTVTVSYATADQTATEGSDYTAVALTPLTFAPGDTSKTVTILVTGDAVDEANESFAVNLSSPTNATISDAQGVGTITDDDAAPMLSINNQTVIEGNTGTVDTPFTVTLSAASGQTVTVHVATANQKAVAPGDYAALTATTLTFAPGDLTKTVMVAVTGDTVDEANETFAVNLSGATNATIADAQGVGTITDDDAAPTLSINNQTVTEGNTGTVNATFTVTLSAVSGRTVTVAVETADQTAVEPADYAALAATTLTFAPGEVTKTVIVAVTGDAVDEANETFAVNLSGATNATISDARGVGTITDDDSAPTLSINNQTVTEGNIGTVNATFTVTLSAASGRTVTVAVATANLTALAPGDYAALATTTLTFAPGNLTKTVVVLVNGDTTTEPNETFAVNLTNATNATIADGQGIAMITDDDPHDDPDDDPDDDAALTLSINDQTVTEGNTGTVNATFTVTLSAVSGRTVTVAVATANQTAVAPADYAALAATTLTFAPGDLTKTVTVAVTGDSMDEANETFAINLSGPTNATIGDAQGVGTITDDDAAPTLSINNQTVTEGSTGTVNATFTVTLSAASGRTVTVAVETANVTAVAPGDYAPLATTTLTFAPGNLTKTVVVLINGDTTAEPNETFAVNLTNATNATIADAQGIAIITDDDRDDDTDDDDALTPTTATPIASLNSSTYGQSVTLSTTVTGAGSLPTATVALYDNGMALGTARLTTGSASPTTSTLAAGMRSSTAGYSGDSKFTGSTSTPLTQAVNRRTEQAPS